eukprot:5879668-Alexandrium_andersonii.AAC.1
MQLERPPREIATSAAGQASDMVPDISDIEPEEYMEVGSEGFPPTRLPGLARAGGLPQATAAAIPGAAATSRHAGAGAA